MEKNSSISKASNFVGKKWTVQIILEIAKGQEKWKRYNQIKSKLGNITPKMLSARLKELEKEGVIAKRVDSTVIPIKSEYSITKHGEDFLEILNQMKNWSAKRQ